MTKHELGLFIVAAIQFVMIFILYRRYYLLKRDIHALYVGLVKQITFLTNLIAGKHD